jgi:DNA-binding SARP family transcriptional activator/tetratricopeptide (TPR) repeat protein
VQPLEVVLFGGFALRRGNDTVPPIPSRVGRSLFAYLVVNRGIPQPRERLVAELWPELSEVRGRRRLSHTLWQLQDALGELPGGSSYLEVRADTLAFNASASLQVDVDAFEQGLEELRHLRDDGAIRARDLGRLEQVVDLYRGDFLDGHYEPWVLDEQERLGQRYLEALGLMVGVTKRFGAYDDALVYARRLTNRAPLREDAHREVMRLSMLLGRPAEAIKQYDRCVEVLADELGTVPAGETTGLYERVMRQQRIGAEISLEPPRPDAFPDHPPLVGRARERQAALSVLEASLGGRGGAVMVEGDPGVGKTRLIEEIIEDGGWRGFAVLSTTCSATELGGAFGVVQGLLTDWLTALRVEHLRHRVEPVWLVQVAKLVPALARILPASGDVPPDLQRAEGAQRMRDAFVRVFVVLSEIDPTLLVVDDVQWADDESLAVLVALAAELSSERLALVVGYRADEARSREAVWEAVQRIDRAIRPARLLLGPMDAFSLGELVRSVARGYQVDPSAISRLQRETGGNPLFVVETLRELAQGDDLGALSSDDPTRLPVPGSIRDLLLARLDRLPGEGRSVLEVAAVVGDRTDLDTLASAVELPRSAVLSAVDLLVRRSLVRELDDGFGLHHDQIRRVVLDAIEPPALRALHRRVGLALEAQSPDEVERLAHHFEAAGDARQAVRYLWDSARRAVSLHAYATADGFYRRAAERQATAPASLSARFDLLAEHDDVLDVLGERERQQHVVEELAVLAGNDARRNIEVTRRRALLAAELGDLATAVDLADRAVAGAEELGDAALLGPALRAAASARSWMGRRDEALPLWERAIIAALSPEVAAESRTLLASLLRELDRHEEAIVHLNDALQIAEASGQRREQARALGVLGSIRMERGESTSAIDLYRRSLEICQAIGFRRGQAINLLNLGNVLYGCSDVAGSLRAYGDAADLFASLADQRGSALVRMNRGLVVAALAGDDPATRSDLDVALTFFLEAGDGRFEALCRDALAGLDIRAGDLERAQEQVDAAFACLEDRDDAWAVTPLLARRAEIALARGEDGSALIDAEEARRAVESHHLPTLLPGILALLGRIHLASDQVEVACDLTGQAVASLIAGVERPFLVRLAHHDALLAAGRAGEAHAQAHRGAAELRSLLASLDQPLRTRCADVRQHARLLEVDEAAAEATVVMRMAAVDAPRGRALREIDLIEVQVELPQRGGPEDPVERRRWLLAEVVEQIRHQGGAPTVLDLAALTEVSEATIRRDLAALRDQGRAVPTRGARLG